MTYLINKKPKHFHKKVMKDTDKDIETTPWKRYLRDLWLFRHCSYFRHFRTKVLTFIVTFQVTRNKGQHLQVLQCFQLWMQWCALPLAHRYMSQYAEPGLADSYTFIGSINFSDWWKAVKLYICKAEGQCGLKVGDILLFCEGTEQAGASHICKMTQPDFPEVFPPIFWMDFLKAYSCASHICIFSGAKLLPTLPVYVIWQRGGECDKFSFWNALFSLWWWAEWFFGTWIVFFLILLFVFIVSFPMWLALCLCLLCLTVASSHRAVCIDWIGSASNIFSQINLHRNQMNISYQSKFMGLPRSNFWFDFWLCASSIHCWRR